MSSKFEALKSSWEVLGKDDPLWAVVSHQEKRGSRWSVEEFLETGERDIAYYGRLIQGNAPRGNHFRHVLDFGCGVGRLSRAWSSRAEAVTGVDISQAMVDRGRSLIADRKNVTLVVNQTPTLSLFADKEFDLVFSLICLQHIPWPFASAYLSEFARICSEDGLVAFQLPSKPLTSGWGAFLRKSTVDALPAGIRQAYRRWRHGAATVFEMHYTPAEVVEETANRVGLKLIHREPDRAAGDNVESFFYIFCRAR